MKTQNSVAAALLLAPPPAWAIGRHKGEHRKSRRDVHGLVEMLRGKALKVLSRDESLKEASGEAKPPLDLTQLARETACLFDTGQGSASHPIQFEGTGACWVRGDREQLCALMMCLLLNAGGHSSPGRAISVSVWCHDEHAHLSVLDRGQGQPPNENEGLFQPFRRLEATAKVAPYSDSDGAWWLSLAAHIAYAHGGDILVAGTPGLGSEVDVRLPLCPRRDS